MHFVGPDQLHGFEERLTTDIYPADFGWTPDYDKPDERISWWYHNLGSVTGAGVAETTNQLEYDDEVAYEATRKIYDLARGGDDRPWSLTVSFTHPHDPYVARKKYWDRYADCDHLLPKTARIPYAQQDAHSQRLLDASDWRNFDISTEDIRRSRRAYFANISYIDDKIGEVMAALNATRQEAVIVFVSDHGDMLGERGLWFKMSFFEGSARVPLMIAAPSLPVGKFATPVSTLDVTPTLVELAGKPVDDIAAWTDGESLVNLANGAERTSPVLMEFAAEGSSTPLVSMRYGRWKYNRGLTDPDQLFDLEAEPNEMTNLASNPAQAGTLAQLRAKSETRWKLETFDASVRESQARRRVVYDALRNGAYYPWDYQPLKKASERFMRNHMDLDNLEGRQRFPRGE